MSSTLVELCAGSAAVSMRLLGNAPATRYMGGKGRFADSIIDCLEITDVPDRIILVDPGPWGTVWTHLPGNLEAVTAGVEFYLRAGDDAATWKTLAAAPVPENATEYITVFLILQTLSWRSKPITEKDGKWVTSGIDRTMALGIPGTERFGEVMPQLPQMAKRLKTIGRLDRIEGHRCSALDLEPVTGATVYIDPPYRNTQGYGHDFERDEVLSTVDRWLEHGARVAISEAEPIKAMRRTEKVGMQGASASLASGPRREEWLSMSFPASQISMF